MHRRALFELVGGTAVAALAGVLQPSETGADSLARVLGLQPGEEAWLNDLWLARRAAGAATPARTR